MKKWEIRATPSADDPDRHVLLLQGGPADVSALLKKFGAMMGRPTPAETEGFNLSLVLHRLKPAKRAKLDAWLQKAAPAATPAAEPPPVPAPVTLSTPPSAPPAAGPAEFSLSVALREDLALETLLVGAYNRFAHAAAMSVTTSPGAMYNPLFLYGAPGTGKSHMLNAIGVSLAKELGGSAVLATSGSRLSRSVSEAVASKDMAEIDVKVANSKALLIDDIHLMALTEQNKDALAKIFKSFFDRKRQVVITSLYPPRALAALEEALKFWFSKGWSVDLKIPGPAAQKDVIEAAAERFGAGLSADDIVLLHERLAQWGYSDLNLWLKRLMVFKMASEAAGRSATLEDTLRLIYEPALGGTDDVAKISETSFAPPPAPAGAEPMAVITPKGVDGLGAFVASRFYGIGAKYGFPRIYRHVLWETYDPDVPFGAPFLIGEMCLRAGVTRALIVGPAEDTPLGPRSAEFAHATRRILESYGVEMAWIPHGGLTFDAHYLNAHLDIARLPPKA